MKATKDLKTKTITVIGKNCPFQNSHLVPTNIQGRFGFAHQQCGSACVLFTIPKHLQPLIDENFNDITHIKDIQLACAGETYIDIEFTEEPKQPTFNLN
jgi:hypothetical protein